MSIRQEVLRSIAWVWAALNTALGAVAGLVMLCLGGRLRLVGGVAEVHGGRAGRYFAAKLGPFCDGALVLGHVILGTSHAGLVALREHAHVHQYERWGIFFLPAYALSSAWQAIRGRGGYRDNYFEKQAFAFEFAQRTRPGLSPNPCARRRAPGGR